MQQVGPQLGLDSPGFRDPLHVLPNDLSCYILSFLTLGEKLCNAALVHTTWLDAIRDPHAWLALDLTRTRTVQLAAAAAAEPSRHRGRHSRSDVKSHLRLLDDLNVHLSYWAHSFAQLQVVRLDHMSTLRAASFRYMTRHCAASLRVLSLRGTGASSEMLATVLPHCEQLEELWVGANTTLHSEVAHALVHLGPRLRVLDLGHCAHVTDAALERLAQVDWPQLGKVVLAWDKAIGDEALGGFLARCPALVELDVGECSELHGACFLPQVAQVAMHSLRVLRLSGLTRLEDAAFVDLATCSSLRELHLDMCTALSDEFVSNLLERNAVHALRTVTLSWNARITDAAVVQLAETQPRLECVVLARCSGVGDDSVRALSTHCPHLQHLSLNYCRRVTDDSLHFIASGVHATSLTSLHVAGLRHLSHTAMQRLPHSIHVTT